MSSSADSPKILPLTALRFFAALYILLYHLAISGDQPWLQGWSFFSRFARLGYVSVSFFFLLSGFVLALAYYHQRSTFSTRDFFVARFARIYPSLAVCLLLDLVRVLFQPQYFHGYSPKHIAWILFTSFAALEAWFQQLLSLDPPTWTISVEVFFYLLFPLLGALLWRLRPRHLLAISVALYALSNLTLLYLTHHQASLWTLYINPVHHLPEFLLGICLARCYVALGATPQRHVALTVFAPTALIASVLAFLLIPFFNISIPAPLLQHAVLAPLFALAVLAMCSGHATLTTIFSTRWLVILGESSFTLYLIHMPLLNLFHTLIVRHTLIGTVLCIATAIAYSVASFFWLETPSRRFLIRKSAVRSRESNATASLAQ